MPHAPNWKHPGDWLYFLFCPGKIEYSNDTPGTKGWPKAPLETLTAALILYASYSELSDKILKWLFLDRLMYGGLLGRLLAGLLGLVACGYIINARKSGDPKTFAYSQFPRILAVVFILLILISVVRTGREMYNLRPPTLGNYESSFDLPADACVRVTSGNASAGASATYKCRLAVPKDYTSKFNSLQVFVLPRSDYSLKEVAPMVTAPAVLPVNQEPLESKPFGDARSEWVFPDFDAGKNWTLTVVVSKKNGPGPFSDSAPIKITAYLIR